MGCVHMHACVCLSINVSLMRFLCGLVLFHSGLFGFLFACLSSKEKDRQCGVGWVGKVWEEMKGRSH